MKVTGSVYLGDGFVSHGELRLLGASIGGDLSCDGGAFNNEGGAALNIQSVRIGKTLLLRGVKDWEGGLMLINAQCDYLLDTDLAKSYPQRVWLSDFRYRAIYPEAIGSVQDRLAWLAMSDRSSRPEDAINYLPDPQPYRHLASVLREQGFEGRARLVMRACARRREWARFANAFPVLAFLLIYVSGCRDSKCATSWAMVLTGWRRSRRLRVWKRLRRARRRYLALRRAAGVPKRQTRSPGDLGSHLGAALRALGMVLYGVAAGHGYNRMRPFYWVAFFILFGGLVFSDFDPHDIWHAADPTPGVMQPTQALAIKDATNGNSWMADYPAFRPLAYSADAFLPLVNLHQESYWTPKDSWVKSFYLPFHIIMGWVVTTLAAVSITGLVRRERE